MLGMILIGIGITDIKLPKKKKFTGREVFSFLLPDDFNAKFESKNGMVVIKKGQLIEGIIDSKAISSEKGKLIDLVEKLYGTEAAHEFIDRVSLIGIKYLDMIGFTMGLDDIDLDSESKKKIKKLNEDVEKRVDELIELYNQGKIELLPASDAKESLEAHILRAISRDTEKKEKLVSTSLGGNCATAMAMSGARASMAHITQLTGSLGQSRILGERIHRGYRGRTLSHFKIGDLSTTAHGFSKNSFKDGLNPFEFFFDAVSGRESLMDKSLRTRHSGYLERRLMNALQDLMIDFDYTVKDNRGIVIQFVAGEDKLDPAKSDWGTLDVRSIVQSIVRK